MIVGNTVRLRAEFKDFDGNLYDPNDVEVTIYSSNMAAISTSLPIRESLGVFYLDYTLTENDYAFEFAGEINNFPVLSRMPLRASTRL